MTPAKRRDWSQVRCKTKINSRLLFPCLECKAVCWYLLWFLVVVILYDLHFTYYLETVIWNPVYNRVTFYLVPKVFQDWFGFTLFYSAIARENSLHFLNESISTRSFALSRALSRLPALAFGFSLNWLLVIFSIILISDCDFSVLVDLPHSIKQQRLWYTSCL